ncbi:restriction endonuclease [Lachnotalea glycerini]|uniref:FtsK gamma domain-containing protein n=1 Tax=Lachnotalea glycerini TaxID=1763509 RepID=A0A371JCG1_9FIRM|nr:restriction endonuclease [Lachnotalea glycerini]RDY30356.1 hypothetical protein CG710_014950 [Lachnotalea glycerini]
MDKKENMEFYKYISKILNNKYRRFLLPLPTLTLMTIFSILTLILNKEYTVWFNLFFILFIYFIVGLPLNIVIFLYNKLRKWIITVPREKMYTRERSLKENDNTSEKIYISTKNVDVMFKEAAKFLISKNKVSIGMLQRAFKISFNRASKIMDQLVKYNIVSEPGWNYNRTVLITLKDFEENFIFTDNKFTSNSAACANYNSKNKERFELYNNKYDYMTGTDFENFCAELLKRNGFYNVKVTKLSSDQGIDILAEQNDVKFGIQCKCYLNNIGNSAVQEAFAGAKFYNRQVAVVLTNQYFTTSAVELAKITNVVLWNRDFLNNLIKNAK